MSKVHIERTEEGITVDYNGDRHDVIKMITEVGEVDDDLREILTIAVMVMGDLDEQRNEIKDKN